MLRNIIVINGICIKLGKKFKLLFKDQGNTFYQLSRPGFMLTRNQGNLFCSANSYNNIPIWIYVLVWNILEAISNDVIFTLSSLLFQLNIFSEVIKHNWNKVEKNTTNFLSSEASLIFVVFGHTLVCAKIDAKSRIRWLEKAWPEQYSGMGSSPKILTDY